MRKWVAGLGLAAVISWGAWYLLSGGRPATQSPAAWIAPAALVRADSDAARRVQSVIDRVQSQPEDAEAWYRLGLAYVASGAEGPARDCMQQAVLRDRMHARARYHLAVIEEQRGEVTLATALCREALSLEPSYVPGWCRLGEWLLEQDELSGARRAFETAQSKPGSPS